LDLTCRTQSKIYIENSRESKSEQLIWIARTLDDNSDVNESKWHVSSPSLCHCSTVNIEIHVERKSGSKVRKNIFAAFWMDVIPGCVLAQQSELYSHTFAVWSRVNKDTIFFLMELGNKCARKSVTDGIETSIDTRARHASRQKRKNCVIVPSSVYYIYC